MAKYASHLPRDGYTDCFFKAVLSIHRSNFRQAQMVCISCILAMSFRDLPVTLFKLKEMIISMMY